MYNLNDFAFELNIDKDILLEEAQDAWGAAFFWNKIKKTGVEYNYCIDGDNCSAIYKTIMVDDVLTTDYSTFVHYEIDFGDKDWKTKLCQAMLDVYAMFYGKEG